MFVWPVLVNRLLGDMHQQIALPWYTIWSNYSDLTRPHPKWWFSKGNPLISGFSRLVNYYNLARYNGQPKRSSLSNFPCCERMKYFRPGVQDKAGQIHFVFIAGGSSPEKNPKENTKKLWACTGIGVPRVTRVGWGKFPAKIHKIYVTHSILNWWFGILLIHLNWVVVWNIFYFIPIWGRFPFWLIFFKWVETRNHQLVN